MDATARVWDAQTGHLLLELKGHKGVVHSVTFSPDGSCLLTGSADGTARVWYTGVIREFSGAALQLMSWGDGSRVPTESAEVIVGTDSDGLLHIRTFFGRDTFNAFETRDSSGALHLKSIITYNNRDLAPRDLLESGLLPTQSRAIAALRQHLPGLLPPHVLSSAERAQVLSAVTLIVGTGWSTVRPPR
jgi:hypothetical protein